MITEIIFFIIFLFLLLGPFLGQIPFVNEINDKFLTFRSFEGVPVIGPFLTFGPREVAGLMLMLMGLWLPYLDLGYEVYNTLTSPTAVFAFAIIGIDLLGFKSIPLLIILLVARPFMWGAAQGLCNMSPSETAAINCVGIFKQLFDAFDLFAIQMSIGGLSWIAIAILHSFGPFGLIIGIIIRTVMLYIPFLLLPYAALVIGKPYIALCGILENLSAIPVLNIFIIPIYGLLCAGAGSPPFPDLNMFGFAIPGFTVSLFLIVYDVLLIVTCGSILSAVLESFSGGGGE